MTARRDDLHAALRATCNERRRGILDVLLSADRGAGLSIAALSHRVDMDRFTVSRHLSLLREAGLVSESRSGRQRMQRIEPTAFDPIVDWALRFVDAPAGGFAAE